MLQTELMQVCAARIEPSRCENLTGHDIRNAMTDARQFPWDHPRFRSWIAVGRACQVMNQYLAREIAALDIKPPHLDILVNLYRFEGLTQQELARKLLVGRSNMSMLLPQMEKRNLITRQGDATDRRVLRLFLTDQGRVLTEQAMEIQTQVIGQLMEASTLEECAGVADVMERLTATILNRAER
jgi:MarR family transcriptional regulator, organic hydroperoxide resistance regulator